MSKSKKIHIEWDPHKSELIAIVACIFTVIFIASFALISYTPLRNLVPGYPDKAMRDEMAIKTIKIDSLERCMYRWELYSRNLKEVLSGSTPITIDSVLRAAGYDPNSVSVQAPVPADSALRAKMEKNGAKGNPVKRGKASIEGKHFFTPVKGSIFGKFDDTVHPYIEITAPAGSSVMSVLDGTVIFKEWNDVMGWSVVIQHAEGIVSIYQNVGSVLKDVSDKVSAGTTVAILGQNGTPDSTTGRLHFELWHNGVPEDPSHLISF